MMTVCLKILQIDMSFNFTFIYKQEVQKDVLDLRNLISPKKHSFAKNLNGRLIIQILYNFNCTAVTYFGKKKSLKIIPLIMEGKGPYTA